MTILRFSKSIFSSRLEWRQQIAEMKADLGINKGVTAARLSAFAPLYAFTAKLSACLTRKHAPVCLMGASEPASAKITYLFKDAG